MSKIFSSFSFWVAQRLHRNQKVLIVLVISGLIVGVAQNIGVGLLLSNIKRVLSDQSRTFLVADIEIRSVEPLNDTQIKKIHKSLPSNAKYGKQVESISIAVPEKGMQTALVNLKAVDHTFPFYGKLKLRANNKEINAQKAIANMQRSPEVWIDQSLRAALGLKEGDILHLGSVAFRVMGYIDSEPGQGIQGFSFGPRVYMGLPYLYQSGLLDEGSRVSHLTLIKLQKFSNAEFEAKAIKKILKLNTKDNYWKTPFLQREGTQVITHMEKARQWIRLYGDLTKYFKLISIILLVLTTIATGCMLLALGMRLLPQFGIMVVLGATPKILRAALGIFILKILSVGISIGTVFGIVGYWIVRSYYPLLPSASGISWALAPIVSGMLEALILGVGVGILPMIVYQFKTPITIISKQKALFIKRNLLIALAGLWVVVCMLFFWIETGNYTIALISANGIAFLFILISWGYRVWIKWIPKITLHWPFSIQYGINNLYRYRRFTILLMTILTLGVLSLGIVGHYKSSYIKELSIDKKQSFPDLFLVGIDNTQSKHLISYFHQWTSKLVLSPVVKARLTAINGKSVEEMTFKTPEQKTFAIREQNLSYRTQLSHAEEIRKGEWMKGFYQNEASIESRFASELGIKLGDSITFTVQGVDLDVKVTSIRSVRWTSFSPNFFILLSPSAIQDAPKEWLGTVANLERESLYKIQAQLAEQFPNITIIPVKESVQKVSELLEVLFWAIQLLTSLAMVAGTLALLAIILININDRKEDFSILKILGFGKRDIFNSLWLELMVLVGVPFVVGMILASGISAFLITKWTSIAWVFPFLWIMKCLVMMIGVVTLLSWGLTAYLYKTKPKF